MDFAQKKTPEKKKAKKITADYLHNSGLYYLQRFAASREQFRAVMLRKIKRSCLHHPEQAFEPCQEMLDTLIKKFIDSGLLNDDLYTQGAVASLRRQGKSKKAIATKLIIRGVSGDLISKKIGEYDAEKGGNGD
ncbi:MAG: RecX family transcriptional regulator, partial [Alphaproteobacteria bacterium]